MRKWDGNIKVGHQKMGMKAQISFICCTALSSMMGFCERVSEIYGFIKCEGLLEWIIFATNVLRQSEIVTTYSEYNNNNNNNSVNSVL